MPIIDITLAEGRSAEQKSRLVQGITAAVVEAIGAPASSVRIMLREIATDHFAVGGVFMKARVPEPAAE